MGAQELDNLPAEDKDERYIFDNPKQRVQAPIHGGEMELTAFGILVGYGQGCIDFFYSTRERFRDAKLIERCPNGQLYIRDERYG